MEKHHRVALRFGCDVRAVLRVVDADRNVAASSSLLLKWLPLLFMSSVGGVSPFNASVASPLRRCERVAPPLSASLCVLVCVVTLLRRADQDGRKGNRGRLATL